MYSNIPGDDIDTNTFTYWQEKDEFTDEKRTYLDTKIWIEHEKGSYLDLQFQCFNERDALYPREFNLVISSRETSSDSTGPYIGAVLYRRDKQPVSIYHTNSEILSNFTDGIINVYSMFSQNTDGSLPTQVKFRFVYGTSTILAEYREIADLSRAPSADLTINTSDANVRKFLLQCFSNVS